ncbi:Plug domain-containing protein, partial [Alistipes communis]|uniref:Plug domain-containing protein n=1 Tax=Alistipes communis TaxID=2585118 RepID=UPI0003792124
DDGGSVEVTGVVKNDREEVVDTLRTLHGGMGCLRFTAHTGERYYAECTMAGGKTERFDLPASRNTACVLKILQTEENFTVLPISGRPLPKGLKLLVHCRGNICYHKPWNYDYASLIFRRSDLPGGILQILLLDKAGNALSERLVFNRGEELATTDVQVRGSLKQRTKVTLAVTATDPDGRPAAGDFSIAVTDRAAVPSATSGSIYSTLLLTSELRGTIETPDWYFEGQDAARVAALDALLLTQGWRRYDVPELMKKEYVEPQYPLEVGQEITGRISKSGLWNRRKKLSRYEMRMIVPSLHYVTKCAVDDTGAFALNGFDFPDSTLYVLRPAAVRGSMPEATVKVARDSFPEVGTLPRVPAQEQKKPYIAQARYYIEQRGQTDMRNILIDTVYVTHHKRLESTRPEHRLAARTWTAEQIKESGAGTILDFIARMPGMSVVGRQVSYRGYRPGFMVDGRLEETVGEMNPVRAFRSTGMGRNHKTQTRLPPIPDPGGWIDFTGMNYSNTNSAQQSTGGNKRQIQYIDDFDNVPDILYYPLEIVSRIDLIEGGNMVLWGVSHWKQAGIISITTKKGKELDDATRTLPARDVEFVSPLGYQTPAEFYAPAYATEKARRSMVPDYRTTLYWNPTVKLDDTGQATVEFYTSDAPADYDITIEGITQTGKIVRTVKIITE